MTALNEKTAPETTICRFCGGELETSVSVWET